MKLKHFLPVLDWLPAYQTTQFKGDLIAGLTVGVMLIPQGMAYALIAGLPPIYGLYASTIPLILYALLGTSRQLAVGPVAMVSLLTAAGIGTLAQGGTETYILLAIALSLFVGLIQLLLGVFRLGFLVNFLSHPVISGFTSAAALIIGLSQLKHLLGVDLARSHYIHEILLEALQQLGSINWLTLALGIGGIVLIKGSKRIHRSLPGPLIAVALGILVVWGFRLDELGVKVLGSVPQGLPGFAVPTFSMEVLPELFPIAMAIALVSFMESIAVAKAIQARHKNYTVSANQELIALGAANIGGSFFQAYPTTGGFSRTAVNDQAGAQTGLATLISAGLILLTLLFLTPLFFYLPKALLASVIMVAVAGLIDYKEAVHLWHTDRTDFWMLVATFVATLSLGIEQGIGIGVLLSLAMVIYRTTRPHIAVLGRVPGSDYYRNVDRFQDLEVEPNLLILRFDSELYFANTQYFRDQLLQHCADKGPELKGIVLVANSITSIDSSGIHALKEIVSDCQARGLEVFVTGVIGPVRDAMRKGGLIELIGKDHFFMSEQEAVDSLLAENPATAYQPFTMQTNS